MPPPLLSFGFEDIGSSLCRLSMAHRRRRRDGDRDPPEPGGQGPAARDGVAALPGDAGLDVIVLVLLPWNQYYQPPDPEDLLHLQDLLKVQASKHIEPVFEEGSPGRIVPVRSTLICFWRLSVTPNPKRDLTGVFSMKIRIF